MREGEGRGRKKEAERRRELGRRGERRREEKSEREEGEGEGGEERRGKTLGKKLFHFFKKKEVNFYVLSRFQIENDHFKNFVFQLFLFLVFGSESPEYQLISSPTPFFFSF